MVRRRMSRDDTVLVLNGHAEGYLIKQGGRIKTWKKRYFVFHNGCLSYRKDSREHAKILRRETIIDVHYFDKVRNGLCVLLRSGRVLYLSAQNEDQVNVWFDVFTDYLFEHQKHRELRQLYEKDRAPLDTIVEDDDSDVEKFDYEDPVAFLSDTESESDCWIYEF